MVVGDFALNFLSSVRFRPGKMVVLYFACFDTKLSSTRSSFFLQLPQNHLCWAAAEEKF